MLLERILKGYFKGNQWRGKPTMEVRNQRMAASNCGRHSWLLPFGHFFHCCSPPKCKDGLWLDHWLTNHGLQPCYLFLYGSQAWASQVALAVMTPPAKAGDAGNKASIPDWEDPLEDSLATLSSILGWRIPWTVEPGRLQSIGLQRVGHDWKDLARTHSRMTLHNPKNRFYIFKCLKKHKGGILFCDM